MSPIIMLVLFTSGAVEDLLVAHDIEHDPIVAATGGKYRSKTFRDSWNALQSPFDPEEDPIFARTGGRHSSSSVRTLTDEEEDRIRGGRQRTTDPISALTGGKYSRSTVETLTPAEADRIRGGRRQPDLESDPIAAAFGGKFTRKDFREATREEADMLRGGCLRLHRAQDGSLLYSGRVLDQSVINALNASQRRYGTTRPPIRVAPVRR